MKRSLALFTLLALTLAAPALAQGHDMAGMNGLTVTAVDYAYDAPDSLEAGYVDLTFVNEGSEPHHLQIARLNDGVSAEALQAALQQGPEAALPLVELVGGVGVLLPGERQTVVTDLSRPGTYVELCFVENAEGVPHLALGMIRFFEVTEPAAAVAQPDLAPDLVVHLRDFGYDIPSEVDSGQQLWEVVNDGPQPHEMALMKISEGKTMDDVMAYLQSENPEGAPPAEEVGGAQAMATGYSAFVKLDLTPGQYVALCLVPDPETGQPHVALGMITSFTVTD